mgnify:CR=1 FL=1
MLKQNKITKKYLNNCEASTGINFFIALPLIWFQYNLFLWSYSTDLNVNCLLLNKQFRIKTALQRKFFPN